MIKIVILITLLTLLLTPIVSSEAETFFACGGDSETIIWCLGDAENSPFTMINPSNGITSVIIPPVVGGQSPPYYSQFGFVTHSFNVTNTNDLSFENIVADRGQVISNIMKIKNTGSSIQGIDVSCGSLVIKGDSDADLCNLVSFENATGIALQVNETRVVTYTITIPDDTPLQSVVLLNVSVKSVDVSRSFPIRVDVANERTFKSIYNILDSSLVDNIFGFVKDDILSVAPVKNVLSFFSSLWFELKTFFFYILGLFHIV